jgi:hypothetical protein
MFASTTPTLAAGIWLHVGTSQRLSVHHLTGPCYNSQIQLQTQATTHLLHGVLDESPHLGSRAPRLEGHLMRSNHLQGGGKEEEVDLA